jgi:hypothetical protein
MRLTGWERDIVQERGELLRQWGFRCAQQQGQRVDGQESGATAVAAPSSSAAAVPAANKSRQHKTSHHPKEKDTLAAHTNGSDEVYDDGDVNTRELERSAAPVGEPFHTLVLYELPSVLDEPLTVADLREFLAYLAERRGLPDKLLTPPVISRIVNSRACRGAVKFGDALSWSSCDDILQKLAVTELPFQCAHGRPSMAPLLDLRGPQARKRWQLLQEHALRTGICSKKLAL